MKENIQGLLVSLLKSSLKDLNLDKDLPVAIFLDFPADERFGEFSTNLAFQLSKHLKKTPFETAQLVTSHLQQRLTDSSLNKYIKEIKIEGPGFINFYLNNNFFYQYLKYIILDAEDSLKINYGRAKRVLIEFVSANPTGPLSVAHARQAAVGDVLANILNFLGFTVKKEYYLNDEGNQINILGRSIELRLKELDGEKIDFPEDYYQGEYIYEIAKKLKSQESILRLRSGLMVSEVEPSKVNPSTRLRIDGERSRTIKNISEYGVNYILAIIKKELSDFGIKFDYWYSQKALRESGKIKKALNLLKKKNFLYEQDGALWFKSTQFGDDKDRVVIKNDGSFTYLAPDIAYHHDKYKRGFQWLINLWGPDHHGYINRLKSAVLALGKDVDSLSIIIVQLATIFRAGEPIQMSTRRGQYITLREVLDEVGPDAARFFFLMRRTSSHLDFDLEIAKKQTPENPVYYVQYAHARICSILRRSLKKIKVNQLDLTLLREKEEITLIKKLWQFPYCLNACRKAIDPYMLTIYLQELAEHFHKFYDLYRVLGEDDALSHTRLALIEAVRVVIAKGLELLGISRPEEM